MNQNIGKNVQFGNDVSVGHGVIIGDNVIVGDGTIIDNYVTIGRRTVIGKRCHVHDFVSIDPKCIIGNHVGIYHHSHITQGCVIEDKVYIGARVLTTNTAKISHGRSYRAVKNAPVIRHGARIASGAIILPGVTIERECLIGAGAVVTKDTRSESVYFGVPAEWKRFVPKDELLEIP